MPLSALLKEATLAACQMWHQANYKKERREKDMTVAMNAPRTPYSHTQQTLP
jgi:hypothetical protein